MSDGVADRETAALGYSLKHLDGAGIDEYLQGLPSDRLTSVQEKSPGGVVQVLVATPHVVRAETR